MKPKRNDLTYRIFRIKPISKTNLTFFSFRETVRRRQQRPVRQRRVRGRRVDRPSVDLQRRRRRTRHPRPAQVRDDAAERHGQRGRHHQAALRGQQTG